MVYFYLIIAEMALWSGILFWIASLTYFGYNYIKFSRMKTQTKTVSKWNVTIFLLLGMIDLVILLLGILWTYTPNLFGFSATTMSAIVYHIIYNLVSLVIGLALSAHLFFFGKYFFIVQTNTSWIIFGFPKTKKQPKFFFKRTLVAKHYYSQTPIEETYYVETEKTTQSRLS